MDTKNEILDLELLKNFKKGRGNGSYENRQQKVLVRIALISDSLKDDDYLIIDFKNNLVSSSNIRFMIELKNALNSKIEIVSNDEINLKF